MKKAVTVLIIDDSPEDRHAYRAFLSQHDDCLYTFLEADDADEGLSIYNQAHVDLILLDYQLPDQSGLDVLERLRDERGVIGVPVVMTTGRGSEEIAVQALKAGVADYLVKSAVTPASLYRATRNALERGHLATELTRETADREQAQEELRDSEARFRLLVESVQDYAILMLDREGRIDSWNAGARAMFGHHDREIIGQHYRRLFTPEDVRARVPERELEEAAQLRRTSEDRWHVHKNGARLWTSGSISPVLDPTGVHRGYAKVLRDVTERRETALRLQEALEVRAEFLAVASHELRTPTTALKLRLQSLLRQLERADGQGLPPHQVASAVRDATGYVERLHDVLENLLEVSRISDRQVPMTLQSMELGAVVAEVVATLPTAERALVTLEPGDALQGSWDRGRLEQVLRGVIGSAVRHAPNAEIQVRVERVGNAGRITVGAKGADPLADPQTAAPSGRGSAIDVASQGLGLYVARHILQALGGTLRAQGGGESGATFVVELAIGGNGDSAGRPAGV